MSFRLSTWLEYSNGGYIDEWTTRYELHRCNVDFTRNDSNWSDPQSAGMSFRLSTLLEYSNGGYIDECTTRYDLHRCNVDFTHNDSQNDRTHNQQVSVSGYKCYWNNQMTVIFMNTLPDTICNDVVDFTWHFASKWLDTIGRHEFQVLNAIGAMK